MTQDSCGSRQRAKETHHQRLLRAQIEHRIGPLPKRFRSVLSDCPREKFLGRFYVPSGSNRMAVGIGRSSDIDNVYQDQALALCIDTNEALIVSAQSQPSLVLQVLKAIDPKPGQQVLEIGSGSGWLAAMIGRLVGPGGTVTGIEVLGHLANSSRHAIARAGIDNVTIVAADAASFEMSRRFFDAVVCSASLPSIPNWVVRSVKVGGRLLIPLPVPGGTDTVVLFERTRSGFESRLAFDAAFVPAHGSLPWELPFLKESPEWSRLQRLPATWEPLWEVSPLGFLLWSAPLRGYLSVISEKFVAFNTSNTNRRLSDDTLGFGYQSKDGICLVTSVGVFSYGTRATRLLLEGDVLEWIARGRPGRSDCRAFFARPGQADGPVTATSVQWLPTSFEGPFARRP